MSFQEFASNLFGSRKTAENRFKTQEGRKAKDIFEDEQMLKENARNSDDFEEDQIVSGSIPGWLADKKLSKTTKKKSTVKDKDIQEKTAVTGVKEHETDDAVLMSIKKQGTGGSNFAREKWLPKSQFEKFESKGPELGSSKREKAEEIMESRSERAQRTDRRNAAPIADDFEEWKQDPSETDLPGIDTLGSGDDFDDLF